MIRITEKLFKILTSKQKGQVGGLVLLMLIGGVMESLSVSVVLPLISAVMDADNYLNKWYAQIICKCFKISNHLSYVKFLLVCLIILFIVKNLFLLFEYYVQFTFITKSKYDMQKKLMHEYLHKPYIFFLNTSTGDLLQVVARDVARTFNLLKDVLLFYTELIVAIILAITIVIMSPSIAAVLAVVLLLELALIAKVIKPIMAHIGQLNRSEESATNKWFLQSINGIKSIKVENRTDFFEGKYTKHARKIADYDRTFQTLSNAPKMIIEACTVSSVLVYILVMINMGESLINILPQLTAFVLAAMRLLPSMNRISNVMNATPFAEVSLDKIIGVLEKEFGSKQSIVDDEVDYTEKPVIEFKENVRFDALSFRYPSGEKDILDKADMIIKVGESVGIVGPSGAGKTTAIDIMLGLLEPQTGKILVDGIDIRDNMNGWLSHLSYIPQQIFLMDDTIRANVAFGEHRMDIDDDKVWLALKDAQLDDFIKSLPEGLDTTVGEAGVRLSGGQRQRIGIARALYSDPDILFFDEATSALDNETEAAIMESIEHLKGKKTMVIIAHRLTTIENCDVVYRVEGGKITKDR